MKMRNLFLALAAMLVIGSAASAENIAIRAGKVLTMDAEDRVINLATVLIKNGKIEAVGPSKDITIPDGYRVIDASDRWVFPGLIEGHNHIGGSIRDLNENVWLTNPGIRALDVLDPGTEVMNTGLQGGVTAMLVIPGSGSNMGGFGAIMKAAGDRIEDVTVRYPGSLKIAQAGNPERYWWNPGRSYMNYNTRQTLEKAKEYHEKWKAFENGETETKPQIDPVWEDFRGLFEKEFPVSVHTQIYQVFLKTITMLHDELDLWIVPFHCTFDSFKTAELVAERDIAICNGPRQLYFDRNQRKIFGHCERWSAAGVTNLSVNTDCIGSFGTPQEDLFYQATMAVRLGWETYPALRGITIEVAEAFGVDDRIGSIEVGKDADMGLWTGNPLDPRSSCRMTLIDGEVVWDASNARRRRY